MSDLIGISVKQQSRGRSRQVQPNQAIQNPQEFVVDIPVTSIQSESHSFEAEIAQNAIETGAKVSDHVILLPKKVDISFEVSNWNDSDPQTAYSLFEKMFDSRPQVDLVTKHKLIKNMVLRNLQLLNTVPRWGVLACRASFQQVGLADLIITTGKANKAKTKPTTKTGGPDASKSAQPEENKGQKPAKSILNKLF
jgi:hypothetical protein